MNQAQNLQLEFQKGFQERMANQLTGMNMPTRDDVLQIGEDLRVLDARMARMEDKLDQLLGGDESPLPSKSTSPPRTKKPPTDKEQ